MKIDLKMIQIDPCTLLHGTLENHMNHLAQLFGEAENKIDTHENHAIGSNEYIGRFEENIHDFALDTSKWPKEFFINLLSQPTTD